MIELVKKIKLDGSPCRKCAEVLERLERDHLMGRIDRVIVADERDPESEGMKLAAELGVEAAPFFIVTGKDGQRVIYTSFLKLQKEVLSVTVSETEEAVEIMAKNDLDFL